MQKVFYLVFLVLFLTAAGLALAWPTAIFLFIPILIFFVLGLVDIFQTSDAIKRNFPLVGRLRHLAEHIRPQIYQYFIESDTNGRPFNREARNLVYQRSSNISSHRSFGTHSEVYKSGYEWLNHSVVPKPVLSKPPLVRIGGPDCKQPYEASIFNISALGAVLSEPAIIALTTAAKMGRFYHNTGETGLGPGHLNFGGDLVWQIGPQYIHCREKNGEFSFEQFQERVKLPQIKMVELKLSQGAKPGFGRVIPGKYITQEVARSLDIQKGEDLNVPAAHPAFATPTEMIMFLKKLKELSGGKPVGFKICIGKKKDFLAIAKAILKTGIAPDFIAIDGAEGGTGSAPPEFMDSVGMPLDDAIVFVHNVLIGTGLRDRIRIIASGKILGGFDILTKIALGADLCSSARGMMFALGCIQALRCHTNTCPTGVASNKKSLTRGLDVPNKSEKVYNFHRHTVQSFLELIAAVGLDDPAQLSGAHISRRIGPNEIKTYEELFPLIEENCLLGSTVPLAYRRDWALSSAENF